MAVFTAEQKEEMFFMKKFIMALIAALTLVIGMTALAAGDYPYEVSSLTAKSVTGEEYELIPSDSGFIAEIEVEKTKERDNSDYFIVAAYNDDALVSLNYAYANIPVGQKIAYGINIPKADTPINQVKAFVWSSLSGAQPLSEAKTIEGAEPAPPTPTPTLNPDNLPENVYAVRGIVTDTYKSTGGSLRKDEVGFVIRSADNWLGEKISPALDNYQIICANTGDTDIEDHIFEYCEVYIKVSKDDTYTILQIASTEYNKKEELKCADFDYENSNYADGDYMSSGTLYFYSNGKTSRYKIDDFVRLYVNGVEIDDVNEGIDRYVKNNTVGSMVLLDTPSESNTTDGLYDIIKVDYYETIVVGSIDISGDDAKMYILCSSMDIGSWDMDLTDTDVSYEFIKDGEKISVSDIKPNDVLSVRYDVTWSFEDSYFYEVLVSDSCVTGMVQTLDPEDKICTINGTKYAYIDAILGDNPFGARIKYTFYLDAFGRIAYCEEEETEKNIAILNAVYETNGGAETVADLVLPDGSKETYALKTTNIADARKIVYKNGEDGEKYPVENRVIEYSITETSEPQLTIKGMFDAYGYGEPEEYRAAQQKIGNAKFSPEKTKFLDASDPRHIQPVTLAALVDGMEYEAYAFNRSPRDGTYSFIIILSGIGEYAPTTRMAVYNKTLSAGNNDGDIVDAYELYVDGTLKTVNWDSSLDAEELTKGDAIIYKTNVSGEITDVEKLSALDMTSTDTVWGAENNRLSDTAAAITASKAFVQDISTLRYDADLYFGVIADGTDTAISITDAVDGITDEDRAVRIPYSDDCKFYAADYNNRDIISVASQSAVIKVEPSPLAVNAENNQVDWNKSSTLPRLALIKTLDGEATDIYVIIPKN